MMRRRETDAGYILVAVLSVMLLLTEFMMAGSAEGKVTFKLTRKAGLRHHISTDPQGPAVAVIVHTADIQDRDGGPSSCRAPHQLSLAAPFLPRWRQRRGKQENALFGNGT